VSQIQRPYITAIFATKLFILWFDASWLVSIDCISRITVCQVSDIVCSPLPTHNLITEKPLVELIQHIFALI
jgi:hypothetical protein